MNASLMSMLLVMSSLLLLVPSSYQQQFAWRPQGRFGKRMGEQLGDSGLPVGSGLKDSSAGLSQLAWLQKRFSPLDTTAFHAEGIVCISTGAMGVYQCYRTPENTSDQ